MINDCSLTYISQLDSTVNLYRKIENRIKHFEKQFRKCQDNSLYEHHLEIKNLKKLKNFIDEKVSLGVINKIVEQTQFQQLIRKIKKTTVKAHWETIGGYDDDGVPYIPYVKSERKPSKMQSQYLDNLKKSNQQARKNELIYRLTCAISIGQRKGHFLLFNTLTVSPEYYNMVFKRGSNQFINYIKNFDQICKTKNDHQYFGCIEHGSKTNRLHFHVFHILKKVPIHWTDPNRGKNPPINRIQTQAIGLWKYGFSTPIIVRTTPGDAWGYKLHHVWPYEANKEGGLPHYKPIEPGTAGKLANYIGKYLNKQQSIKKGIYTWKTRMSQNLGLEPIIQTMKLLSDNSLLLLATHKNPTITQKTIRVPPSIIIKEATRELLRRKKKNNLNTLQLAMTLRPQDSLEKQLIDLTQRKQRSNSVSTGTTETQNSINTAISECNILLNQKTNELMQGFTYNHSPSYVGSHHSRL